MNKKPDRYMERNGSYSTLVSLGNDPVTGKRKQKRLTAPTWPKLKVLEAKTIAEAAQGIIDPARITVGAYLTKWLTAVEATAKLSPRSVRRYEQAIRLHISPLVGGVALGKLAPLAVQGIITTKRKQGYAPATVAFIYGVLHEALDRAVQLLMINYNPADGVERPRKSSPQVKAWTLNEALGFLEATKDHPLAAIWTMAIFTGMRQGELLALRWSDVDLQRGIATVRRTLTQDANKAITFGPPKSAAGNRQVKLDRRTLDTLKAHKAAQNTRRLALGSEWIDDGLIFDRGNGRYHNPSTVYGIFKRLCKKAGFADTRFHDMRHTAASIMLGLGVPLKIAAVRLGHSDVGITGDLYSHATIEMQEGFVAMLEAATEALA